MMDVECVRERDGGGGGARGGKRGDEVVVEWGDGDVDGEG